MQTPAPHSLGDDGQAPVHWVMLGLMGTGKSVVGAALARRLGLPFSDNDETLAGATHLTAREIRERHGARVLHDLEARHLLEATHAAQPSVICAAASVIEDARCRAALEQPGILPIWLRAKAETLAARFDDQDHRPVFGPDPLAFFRSQIASRYPLFLALSADVIDVDQLSVDAVVDRVIDAVDRHALGGPRPKSRTIQLELDPSTTTEPPPGRAGTEEP
jgi:shikimate kinase